MSLLLVILGRQTSLPFLLEPLIHNFRLFFNDLDVDPPWTWSTCQILVDIYVDLYSSSNKAHGQVVCSDQSLSQLLISN